MSKYTGGTKMAMTIEERRQKTDEIFREIAKTMNESKLHSALVIWISPFGNLDHRVGFFPDYIDCEGYAKFLKKSYENLDMTYEVYVDLGVM